MRWPSLYLTGTQTPSMMSVFTADSNMINLFSGFQQNVVPYLSQSLQVYLCPAQLFPTEMFGALAFGHTAELFRLIENICNCGAATHLVWSHLRNNTHANDGQTIVHDVHTYIHDVLTVTKRVITYTHTSCRRNGYLALVCPVLEYAVIIWDPQMQQDINMLERIQRNATRFTAKDYRSTTPGFITELLRKHELTTLQER